MARRADTYGGEWIKATQSGNIEAGPDMPRDDDRMILTIKGKAGTHEWDDGKKQRVLSFEETEMRLGLNATNWDAIAAMTSQDDDDNWGGTVIELFVVPEPKSKTGHAIRVRKPKAGKPAAPASNGTAIKVLGQAGSERLFTKLTEVGMELNDLRYALFNQQCGGKVDAAPELWPIEWGPKIADWLRKPVKAPADGYKPIAEDDIPFEEALTR
jgi:hypothetical protein